PTSRRVAHRPRLRGPPGERGARRVGRRERHALPRARRRRERGDGRPGGEPLRPLHALRKPGGLPVQLHGDDGDHGRGRRQGHARRAPRGRADVHGAARGAARRGVVAVADARLRRPARPARRLPPARGSVRTCERTSVSPALTVADNVMTGLHLRGAAGFLDVVLGRRRLAAEESRLSRDADGIIDFVGLGHRRAERASELPYGEQRLVELAVALGARPRLLLLDEPGAGMTTAEKATATALICRIRDQRTTVLLVEHDMRMVMSISDTVIVLNHGRVIAEGPPATIQTHPDVIRAYLGS